MLSLHTLSFAGTRAIVYCHHQFTFYYRIQKIANDDKRRISLSFRKLTP